MHTCWKCHSSTYDTNPTGLCDDCFGSLSGALFTVVLIISSPFIWTYQVPLAGIPVNNLPDHVLVYLLCVLVDTIGAVIVFFVVALLLVILANVIEWAVAVIKYLSEKELEEAKQRALEADAHRLDGMQLDALLTERYKEKQGWK